MSRASDLANLIASGNTTIFGEAGVTSSDSTGKTTNLQQGLAKAWFNYDQTTPSVDDSFNTSSISDDSAGVFTNVFTNNMSNAAWAAGFIGRNNRHQFNTDTSATSGRAWRSADSGNNVGDNILNCAICHGDLA